MSSSVLWGSRAVAGALVLGALLVSSASADGGSSSGGAEVPDAPRIETLRCGPSATSCRRGELLSVVGANMHQADTVVFLGGRGPRDDRRARPLEADETMLKVQVPGTAHSGRIKVVASGVGAASSATALKVRAKVRSATPAPKAAPAAAAGAPPAGGVFPIQGVHTYGESPGNVFTGKGGHQGNDVFAACGTPMVAPVAGTVTRAAFQERAGNYVVLKGDDGSGLAFMHLRDAALVKRGQRVTAGQKIGAVGETGRASGCHLHFELWTAPGWYEGGEPVDPRPQLKAWDGAPA